MTEQYLGTSKTEVVSTLKWHYAAGGRELSYIGVEQPFQSDSSYDDHDNVLDWHTSNPEVPDVMKPSEAQVVRGTSFANEYDPNGRLVAATATDYGFQPMPEVRSVFTEDSEGRCTRVEGMRGDPTGVESRSYGADGLIERIERSGRAGESTTVFTYDAKGRTLSETTTGTLVPWGGGTATSTATHTYPPDGSERIEIEDGFTDVTSDRSRVVTKTVACLEIQAEIGQRAARCRAW